METKVTKPICRFRCSVCIKPDCDYDGDYVSFTECRTAARNDKRALWYRKTWKEIEKAKDRHTNSKYVKKKDRVKEKV